MQSGQQIDMGKEKEQKLEEEINLLEKKRRVLCLKERNSFFAKQLPNYDRFPMGAERCKNVSEEIVTKVDELYQLKFGKR